MRTHSRNNRALPQPGGRIALFPSLRSAQFRSKHGSAFGRMTCATPVWGAAGFAKRRWGGVCYAAHKLRTVVNLRSKAADEGVRGTGKDRRILVLAALRLENYAGIANVVI